MKEEKKAEKNSAEEKVTEAKIEKVALTPEQENDKKIKNLISAVILISGLFAGSLFVDVIQMVRGGGFSQRALDSTDVFASNGKTWVAYSEPIVMTQVVNDDACGDACKPDEVLIGLKQALPTMMTQKIDVNSTQGKKLVEQFSLKTIPAFIFSKEIEKTDLFTKAQPFLDKQGDSYAIKSAEAGFPVGKYIAAPAINDKDIKIGSDEAKVKVVEFSDFANPSDAQSYKTVTSQMLKDYADKIQVVFKNYFPPTSAQSASAAMAAQCANEQGKFLPYAEKLYAAQTVWSKLKDATFTFKSYATQLGLKTADFNSCLDGKKYQDQITQQAADGQAFGLNATPAIFVGSDLQKSTATYNDIKSAIDQQLSN